MTNNYSGPERRKFKRVPLKLSVKFRSDKPMAARLRSGDHVADATMIDLGEGGISIVTETDVSIGALLWVKFTLSRIENECVNFYGSIELNGEVRYKVQAGTGYRLGIAFQSIDERSRREIADFLNIVEACIMPQRPKKE